MKKIVLAAVVGLFLVGCAKNEPKPNEAGHAECGCPHHQNMATKDKGSCEHHGDMQNGGHAHDHQMMHKH
ncbi:hypothetical protein [Campylobacter concisus]|jgi:putative lipoprotein|uniref:hypothetical protein n=1 Tax=Campylobacter concisus TaxID=199 RepID=UPI0011E703D2|nr:hypothetical protein [Campylobacter concisus]